MERRNRQIREFLKEREVKKRMAKEREDDRRRIRDMEDKFKREMNRYTVKKLTEKFDTLNGWNRTTISGCRTKFPASLSKIFSLNIELFLRTFTNVELLRQSWKSSKATPIRKLIMVGTAFSVSLP
jgi:hypothetical protein